MKWASITKYALSSGFNSRTDAVYFSVTGIDHTIQTRLTINDKLPFNFDTFKNKHIISFRLESINVYLCID